MGNKTSKISSAGGLLEPGSPPGYLGGDGSITVLELGGIIGTQHTGMGPSLTDGEEGTGFSIKRSAVRVHLNSSISSQITVSSLNCNASGSGDSVPDKRSGVMLSGIGCKSPDSEVKRSVLSIHPIKSSMRVTERIAADSPSKRVRINDTSEVIGEISDVGTTLQQQ